MSHALKFKSKQGCLVSGQWSWEASMLSSEIDGLISAFNRSVLQVVVISVRLESGHQWFSRPGSPSYRTEFCHLSGFLGLLPPPPICAKGLLQTELITSSGQSWVYVGYCGEGITSTFYISEDIKL
uniref:Uncharacterized protein n=1 Tax=Macaca nemestrina TaxID=9545 RepID=A0A2K6AQ49_MACNE